MSAVGEPPRKIDTLRALMAAGEWPRAFALAASFGRLGAEKAAIERAHEACIRPAFQRQLKRDPEHLIELGKAALARRYGGKNAQL